MTPEPVHESDRTGRHRLIGYFGLTFAISWSLWLAAPALGEFDPTLAGVADGLATFGPALAALVLASTTRPADPATAAPRPWLRLPVSLAIAAAGVWFLRPTWSAVSNGPHPVAALLGTAVLSLLPAGLIAGAWSRWAGVAALLAPLVAWRTSPRWYLVALLLFPIASGVGLVLLLLVGVQLPNFPARGSGPQAAVLVTVFVSTALFGGPLGEEIGWRGYALPQLLSRHSPLTSSLILGLVWGAWHAPLHLRGVYDASVARGWVGVGLRLISSVGLAVIFTWLYQRCGRSLLIMVLLHTSLNNTSGYWLPQHPGSFVMTGAVVAVLVVILRTRHPRSVADPGG